MFQVSDKCEIENRRNASSQFLCTWQGMAIARPMTRALSLAVNLASAQSVKQSAPAFNQTTARSERLEDFARTLYMGKDSEMFSETSPNSDSAQGTDASDEDMQNTMSECESLQKHQAPYTRDEKASSDKFSDQLVYKILSASREGENQGAGTQDNSVKTIVAAKMKAFSSGITVVILMSNLNIDATAEIGSKSIVITPERELKNLILTPGETFERDILCQR